ncbi:transporter substrate-binding domain-containing protein [Chitinivorax sp. B]|uniref:transporter substrate-binding domain-containing protein n=1 Tax=Chitinivorax sp. B TaxID=2502235 RepID=UPI0010F5D4C3|nr:transporter substrate-binding domain-containing protein [Chitinivorax sp. B]
MRILIFFSFWLSTFSLADDVLLIKYREKAPYHFTVNGQPSGFLNDLIRTALTNARIPATFESVPVKRIVAEMQQNPMERTCSLSWYDLPERHQFAQFSVALHRDLPHVVITHTTMAPLLQRLGTLEAVLTAPDIILGIVEGVSYGPELDKLIAARQGGTERSIVTPETLAKKLAAGRIDLMFVDQEDLAHLRQVDPQASQGIVQLKLRDMPAGQTRHLMCAKSISINEMRKLNQALGKLVRVR